MNHQNRDRYMDEVEAMVDRIAAPYKKEIKELQYKFSIAKEARRELAALFKDPKQPTTEEAIAITHLKNPADADCIRKAMVILNMLG